MTDDPARITLTDAERETLQRAREQYHPTGPRRLYEAVERILSDRLREAKADAWDECFNHYFGVVPALDGDNPYRAVLDQGDEGGA